MFGGLFIVPPLIKHCCASFRAVSASPSLTINSGKHTRAIVPRDSFLFPLQELLSVKEYCFLINHLSTSLGIVSNGIRNRAAKRMHICIYVDF